VAGSSVGAGDPSRSSDAASGPVATAEGSTAQDATRSDLVRRYMTALSTLSDDALSLVEPGSAADVYTRCEQSFDRDKGVGFFPYNEVPGGYQFAIGSLYGSFSLATSGLIDQFEVDHHPVDQLTAAGDGIAHSTDDLSVTATVVCFVDQTIRDAAAAPDTGVVIALVNSGSGGVTMATSKYEAGGRTYQASPVSRPIGAGEAVTTGVLIPSAPRGGTLKVTITTSNGKNTFDVTVPRFGPR
jgi:hypothetical protein